MKVTEVGDRLTVTHDDTRMAGVFALIGAALTGVAVYSLASAGWGTERSVGATLGALLLWAMAALTFERTRFVFEGTTRTVRWQRRRALGQQAGALPFAEVRGVAAERSVGSTGTIMRRVVLLTDQGSLPLTASYQPDNGDARLRLAQRLRTLLGVTTDEPELDNVAALVATGQLTSAIAQLRAERGLSLSEAKALVEHLQARAVRD